MNMSIQRRIYEKLAGLDTKEKNIKDAKSDQRKKMDDEMANRKESVELEEGPAHQNPLVTAYGGMKAAKDTPSYKRYFARLKAEREARAKQHEKDQATKKATKEEVEVTEGKKKKKAQKDHDGDGKIETPKQEYLGSRDRAIKAAIAARGGN